MTALPYFHSAVSAWFTRTFPAPTPAQSEAWPAIQSRQDVLIAAPTGSGKTLAAFLAAIDELVREGEQWGLPDETRVLRREHEERLGQAMRLSGGRHRMLLHGLQQGRLGFRRGTVDLVRENDVREDGTLGELEKAAPGRMLLLEQLGPRDVRGHQVGRELHPGERQLECFGDGLDEQRLGEAGNADEQDVAAGEQRRDEIVDGLLLADDASADLGRQGSARRCELVEQLEVAIRLWGSGHA